MIRYLQIQTRRQSSGDILYSIYNHLRRYYDTPATITLWLSQPVTATVNPRWDTF